MKTVVISLTRMAERRALISAGFAELGIDYQFFDALDAARGEHRALSRYDLDRCLRTFGAPLTETEIACFASHWSVWQLCVSLGQPVVVMEDDVILGRTFPAVLSLASELIDRHRLIRLYGKHKRKFRLLARLDQSRILVRFLRGPVGGQCYCLSPQGAAALLKGADRWTEPLDLYIDRFWKHGLASKAILPFEVEEMDRGAIAGSIGPRHYRRRGIAKFRREIDRQKQALSRLIYNIAHWPR